LDERCGKFSYILVSKIGTLSSSEGQIWGADVRLVFLIIAYNF